MGGAESATDVQQSSSVRRDLVRMSEIRVGERRERRGVSEQGGGIEGSGGGAVGGDR